MKRLISIIFIMTVTLCAHAVLKEKDLNQTLLILRTELTDYHRELSERLKMNQKQSERVRDQLISIMKRSNQNSLMLYSQKQEYVFDLTYACHEATELYQEFRRQQLPFKTFMSKSETEIARYDSLITSLQSMPQSMLDAQTKTNRSVCLALATSIRNSLEENRSTLEDYINIYDNTEKRLSHLNDYAQKRYNDIQTNIFKNGGESYFTIIQDWSRYWQRMTDTVRKKYEPTDNSQWDSRWIFGLLISVIFYAIIASALNFAAIRYVVPRRFRTNEFMKKRACITMATTTVTFAIILGITLATVEQNFFIMAANLLVTYAWLLGVILISLFQECLSHLYPTHCRRIPGHCHPHHSDTQRAGQHAVSARAAHLCPVAMERDRTPQPECPTIGHVLHLYITGGVHRFCSLFMGGLHADGCPGAHLVDYAAHLHPHHHLYQPISETLWPAKALRRETRYQNMGVRPDVSGGITLHERWQRDAEHLVGGRRIQSLRPLLEDIQLQVHQPKELPDQHHQDYDGHLPVVPLLLPEQDILAAAATAL